MVAIIINTTLNMLYKLKDIFVILFQHMEYLSWSLCLVSGLE